jgi:AraC-like DNA-binding protein
MQTDAIPLSPTLMARLATLGVDVQRVLRTAGVPVTAATLAGRSPLRLSTRRYFALWHAIGEVTSDPAIGLRIGGETANGRLDIVSLFALHSNNLGEALKKLARYKRLTCPEDVRVDLQHGEAAVTFRWLLADEFTPTLLTDAMFASTVALARRGSDKAIKPRRVELTRRPANRSRLARYFNCEIAFDAPADVLVFDAASLAIPFTTHDENILDALLPELDAGLAEQARERSFADEVDAILLRGMQGQRPSVESLALELAMSPRTLQRRLALDGTSYQQRLDQVRRRIARRLLGSTDLGIGEIAWFLGFEEVNSFSRAFHQWEGVTPHRWRSGELVGGGMRLEGWW